MPASMGLRSPKGSSLKKYISGEREIRLTICSKYEENGTKEEECDERINRIRETASSG